MRTVALMRTVGALMALAALAACAATGEYGGYTKEEAKDAGQYGLEQLAQQYADNFEEVGLPQNFSTDGYEIIGAEESTAPTGSDAWLITFANDEYGDQVCMYVWRNEETGDAGRWQSAVC